jgi:polysaccharide chain length determinant protein (PEP-CTERM system associated)
MNLEDTRVAGRICVTEIRRNVGWLIAGGLVIVIIAVAVGAAWPARYESSVSIYIERQNIIDPLMAGRAVRTEVADTARNAQERIYNRGLMLEALERSERMPVERDSLAEEHALMRLRARTSVRTVGDNLVRITYEDNTAEDAFEMTKILAELFMADLLQGQERESTAAFAFIDAQARKYQTELQAARESIHAMREVDPSARPGVFDELNRRQVTLTAQIDDLEQSLREGRIREASLQEQLSGEVEIATMNTRSQRYRQRIAELRDELDRLRLTYHDSYPDIVHIRQQIAELEEQLASEETQRSQTGEHIDDAVRSDPVYQRLQRDLYDVRTEMRMLQDRREASRAQLAETRAELLRTHGTQAEIDRLQRDVQINQDIYEDLLRRRENARVSRSLDAEQQGLKVRIQESAYMPQAAIGPSGRDIALAGVGMAMILPVAALVGWLVVDPRIRHGSHMPPLARQYQLGAIPALPRRRYGLFLAQLLTIGVLAAVLALLLAHFLGYFDLTLLPLWFETMSLPGVLSR